MRASTLDARGADRLDALGRAHADVRSAAEVVPERAVRAGEPASASRRASSAQWVACPAWRAVPRELDPGAPRAGLPMQRAHSRRLRCPRVRACPARRRTNRAPTALRSTGTSRSIESTSTSRSTRSMPLWRTRHTTGTAPRRHQRRRRRNSHAACSRTRARCRSSYVLVLVSTTYPTPPGESASESMSPRPRHGSE